MFSSLFRRRLLTVPPYLLALVYSVLASYGVVSGGVWGGLSIGAALLLALLVGLGMRRFPLPSKQVFVFLTLGLGSAALSSLGGSYPELSWHITLKMLTIFVPLAFLFVPAVSTQGRFFVARIPLVSVLLGASFLVLCLALALSYNLWGRVALITTEFNRGFSYALLLTLPLLAVLFSMRSRRVLAWGLVFICVLALVYTHSRAAQLGAVLALCVFAAVRFWPILSLWGIKVVTIALFVWPWCAGRVYSQFQDKMASLPPSWWHRMEIWDSLSYRLVDSPFLGHGIGSTAKLAPYGPHAELYRWMVVPASHPHNAAVQLWVETGVLGVLFGLFACFWVLWAIKRLSEAYRPYAYAAYVVGLVLAMAAYNLWTDSLWGAYALTAFSFTLLPAEKSEN